MVLKALSALTGLPLDVVARHVDKEEETVLLNSCSDLVDLRCDERMCTQSGRDMIRGEIAS
eukprot:2264600-Amphidinium_carterae.1